MPLPFASESDLQLEKFKADALVQYEQTLGMIEEFQRWATRERDEHMAKLEQTFS